jgi:hypothetical protein
MLRTFDYLTGQLILEKRLCASHEGRHLHTGNLGNGTAIAFMEQSRDILVLTNGHDVRCVGDTGNVQWVWESPDKG